MSSLAVPEDIIQFTNFHVTLHTVLQTVEALIEQHINGTKSVIDRVKGVACYQQDCVRWTHHLEAFHRMAEIIDHVTRKVQQQWESQMRELDHHVADLCDNLAVDGSSLATDAANMLETLYIQMSRQNRMLSDTAETITDMLDQTPVIGCPSGLDPSGWNRGVNAGWDHAIECVLRLLVTQTTV